MRKDKIMGKIIDLNELYKFTETDEKITLDIIQEIKEKQQLNFSKITRPIKLMVKDMLKDDYYSRYTDISEKNLQEKAKKDIDFAVDEPIKLYYYLCYLCFLNKKILKFFQDNAPLEKNVIKVKNIFNKETETEATLKNFLDKEEEKENPKTEEEALSEMILKLQQKDLDEYANNIKKRSYFLSKFFKTELIVRSAEKGCTKTTFKINTQAAKAIIGLAFIVEDGAITFALTPLDRYTYQISCRLNSSKLNNAQIMYYNTTYNLNIPLNEKKEVFEDEDRINKEDYDEETNRYFRSISRLYL